jgi:hypothetical protein
MGINTIDNIEGLYLDGTGTSFPNMMFCVLSKYYVVEKIPMYLMYEQVLPRNIIK